MQECNFSLNGELARKLDIASVQVCTLLVLGVRICILLNYSVQALYRLGNVLHANCLKTTSVASLEILGSGYRSCSVWSLALQVIVGWNVNGNNY